MDLCITGTLIVWIQLRIQCGFARQIWVLFSFFFLCTLFFPVPFGVLARADIAKSHRSVWRWGELGESVQIGYSQLPTVL